MMKPIRPRLAGWFLAVSWAAFLIDRWILPPTTFLEAWITAVGAVYLWVAIGAIRGQRTSTSLIPWAGAALMGWGVVALLGLFADTTSSRSWMWASIFALIVGLVTLAIASLSLQPRFGTVGAVLALGIVLGGIGLFQLRSCRIDLNASWCDPRYEMEDVIVEQLEVDRRAVNQGHLGGVLGPAFASFVFDEPPDPYVDVVPSSATPSLTDDPRRIRWSFGGRFDECDGQSTVQSAVGGYEIRFTVDCRP